MPAKHVELLTKSCKKKSMNKQLIFLKPGQYMSASDNRFVTFKGKEPCLILENDKGTDLGWNETRYIVLAKNEHLIAVDDNFVTEGEMK